MDSAESRPPRTTDAETGAAPARAPAAPKCWDSRQLVGDGSEALIRHAGRVYRLRVTRQNKLILMA